MSLSLYNIMRCDFNLFLLVPADHDGVDNVLITENGVVYWTRLGVGCHLTQPDCPP